MKFLSQDSSPLIAVGEHVAKIDKVYLGEAEGNGRYNDKTEQLVVIFLAAGKQITRWFNLKGYKTDPKKPTIEDDQGRSIPNYLTDKAGNRLEDEANTEACQRIIGQLGHDAGISADEDFEASDLEGKEIGIKVDMDTSFGKDRLKVVYTMPAGRVSEVSEKAQAFAE